MRKITMVKKAIAFSSALCISISSLYFMPVKAQGNSSFSGAGNETKTNSQMKAMEKYVSVMPTNQFDDIQVPVHGSKNELRYSTGADELPEKYCSEDIEDGSLVKNQNPFGTCWAHAALGNLESSLIKKGVLNPNCDVYTRQNADFSERHLAYFTYNNAKDPMGGLDGDSTTVTEKSYLDVGGNKFSAILSLAAWKGAVSESVASYSELVANKDNLDLCNLDESIGMNHEATLRNCKLINFKDRDEIKRMIMEYGSCVISIGFYSSFLNNKLRYCTPAEYGTNHDVLIVGWDDTDSKDNYKNSPREDGCWIVRNSWGPDWGHNGYFYVSYDDKNIAPDSGEEARCFMGQRGNLFNHNYQYDGSGLLSTINLSKTDSIANRFTVPQNSPCEQLKAVSFGINAVNVNYSIQVYKNSTASDPTTGEAMFTTPQIGTIDYAGYYTIPLKQPVLVRAGETFSVVITVASDDESKTSVPFFVDGPGRKYVYRDQNGNIVQTITFKNTMKSGESYIKSSSSGVWRDTGKNSSFTARIKAFTVDYYVRYLGDLNGDGKVNRTDAMGFNSAERTYVNGIQRNQRIYPIRADLDNDGDVDSDDNRLLSQALSSPLQEVNINYGDVNGDGFIDKDDVTAIQSEISKYGTQGYVNGKVYYKAEADMDMNGALDQYDAKILHEYVYGY